MWNKNTSKAVLVTDDTRTVKSEPEVHNLEAPLGSQTKCHQWFTIRIRIPVHLRDYRLSPPANNTPDVTETELEENQELKNPTVHHVQESLRVRFTT